MAPGFDIVVIIVVLFSVVVGIGLTLATGGAHDAIGHGGLHRDSDASPPAPGEARDQEIRQMLEARNARRVARGEEPLDVEAEIRRLEAAAMTATDPGVREEVRQLVEARNARLTARGREPLDVEAEVARRLRDLGAAG